MTTPPASGIPGRTPDRRLAAAAATCLAVGLLAGCTHAPAPGPAHRTPAASQPSTPTERPEPDVAVQNAPSDARLRLGERRCRYADGAVSQDVTVTGTALHPVVATVWLTVTTHDGVLLASGSRGFSLTEAGRVAGASATVSAPLGAEHWNRRVRCTTTLTWTPLPPSADS